MTTRRDAPRRQTSSYLDQPSVTSQRKNVTNVLREAIIFGELKPGTQLKQDDIAQKFGCSPAPVREALRDLESEGLVEHFHNRGVFVTNISNKEIVEVLLPIRLVLEKFALRNASEKFTPGVVDNLNEQIEILQNAGIDLFEKLVVENGTNDTYYSSSAAKNRAPDLWHTATRLFAEPSKIGRAHV